MTLTGKINELMTYDYTTIISLTMDIWIWVNYNMSLTRIVRPFGDDFPQINYDSQGSGEQASVVIIYPEI